MTPPQAHRKTPSIYTDSEDDSNTFKEVNIEKLIDYNDNDSYRWHYGHFEYTPKLKHKRRIARARFGKFHMTNLMQCLTTSVGFPHELWVYSWLLSPQSAVHRLFHC